MQSPRGCAVRFCGFVFLHSRTPGVRQKTFPFYYIEFVTGYNPLKAGFPHLPLAGAGKRICAGAGSATSPAREARRAGRAAEDKNVKPVNRV